MNNNNIYIYIYIYRKREREREIGEIKRERERERIFVRFSQLFEQWAAVFRQYCLDNYIFKIASLSMFIAA